MKPLERPINIGTRMSTYDKLRSDYRYAYHYDKSQIDKHEGAPSMHTGFVWESPDVAEPDSRPHCGSYDP